jgi:hypothetical protein
MEKNPVQGKQKHSTVENASGTDLLKPSQKREQKDDRPNDGEWRPIPWITAIPGDEGFRTQRVENQYTGNHKIRNNGKVFEYRPYLLARKL